MVSISSRDLGGVTFLAAYVDNRDDKYNVTSHAFKLKWSIKPKKKQTFTSFQLYAAVGDGDGEIFAGTSALFAIVPIQYISSSCSVKLAPLFVFVTDTCTLCHSAAQNKWQVLSAMLWFLCLLLQNPDLFFSYSVITLETIWLLCMLTKISF